MQAARLLWLGAFVLGIAGCGSSSSTQMSAQEMCGSGMEKLNACMQEHCEGNPSKICTSFNSTPGGSLNGSSQDPCATMSAKTATRLASASCDELLTEAGNVLDGKADGQCPSYFPWCTKINETETGYDVRVLSHGPGTITLEVTVQDVSYSPVILDGQSYHRFGLEASGIEKDIGKPAIPTVGMMVGVPGDTDTAWIERFEIAEKATLSNIQLAPLQEQVLEGAPAPGFAIDAAAYAVDGNYPGKKYDVDPIATWRNFRVVRVQTYPVQYNPVTKDVEVATRYTVVVRFANTNNQEKDTIDTGTSVFAEAYDNTLVNYVEATDDAVVATTDDGAGPGYLFIVDDALKNAIQPLVDLRKAQGMDTEVLLVSQVPEGPEPLTERIKEEIRKRYEAKGIGYVLLVGNEDAIPPNNTYNWVVWSQSDTWYGCLAGDDSLPEVSLGRMTGTAEDVKEHVKKILAHELLVGQPTQWRHRVMLVAHEEDYPEKYTECLESVRNAEYKSKVVEFVKQYGGEGATNDTVLEELNEGVGIVNYRGHGWEHAWAEWNRTEDDYFSPEHITFTNAERLPVFFSIACLNGAFHNTSKSLAEHLVHAKGGGAVGVLASTEPSYTVVNHDFNRYLFQALLNDGIVEAGQVVMRSNALLFAQYGDHHTAEANMLMYVWFGDPAMRIGDVFATEVIPEPTGGGIIINEVMSIPASGLEGDTNGDGKRHYLQDEFVELVNTGSEAMDISGWTLWDSKEKRVTFEPGTIIPGGKALVVFGGGDPAKFADMGGSQVVVAPDDLKLNDTGDSVRLERADETTADMVEYTKYEYRGMSMVRETDGKAEAKFIAHPGTPAFSPGRKQDGTNF